MDNLSNFLATALFIGLGATLTFDAWAQALKYACGIVPSDICLVGRWLRYMPDGVFRHPNLGAAPRKSAECAVGWVAHYLIGTAFAALFLAVVGNGWLQHPTPAPALLFGGVTVLAPFLILQPAFGLGVAACRARNPTQARIRSVMNHLAFGAGLYVFALLAHGLHRA